MLDSLFVSGIGALDHMDLLMKTEFYLSILQL